VDEKDAATAAFYRTYDNIKPHQLCCIHLIRELVAATENDGMRWSEEMGDFLSRAIGNPARPLPTAEQESLSKEYDTVISRGQAELGPDPEPAPGKKRVKRGKSKNLFGRLKSFKEFVLTFTKVPDVPPTNNGSEQDVRKGKIQQNVSHCFRTKEGASLYFDIMSYIVTLRKDDVNIFSGIVSAMKGKPVIPFSPATTDPPIPSGKPNLLPSPPSGQDLCASSFLPISQDQGRRATCDLPPAPTE